MASITIQDKNSYKDFDALLVGRDISPPEIKDICVDIPYKNGDICFTYVNSEKPVYNTRTLTYTFEFVDYPKSMLRKKITMFENWIMNSGECEIYDDSDMTYHFRSRPISCKEAESGFKCTVTVTFKAYPFRISENYANATWDNFCFETDYLNPLEYKPSASGVSKKWFYNYGTNDICPGVEYIPDENVADAGQRQMIVCPDNGSGQPDYLFTTAVRESVDKLDGFVFHPGYNVFFVLHGTGTIRFKACEEVI